ncbi:MAG: hypothetical protein EXS08_04035 [Planctomycetes bacterium]|nr:hypothetical protein [Planctomycetota bacterium]
MLAHSLAQLLPLLLACSCSPAPQGTAKPAEPLVGGEFEALWYDGQAEMNGYRWQGTRYGELRTGEAVAIFVTESMGAKEHVKVDRPAEYKGEVLTVLKLNLVRDFQTGLYDYNTMSSVFVGVNELAPLKLTFSSAEWCGHVYEELDVRPQGVALDVHSYFQGETVQEKLDAKPDALFGDQLFVWLRGLRGHVLAPGETRRLPYLTDTFERRLRHGEASWGELEVTREAAPQNVTVPAGAFAAVFYRLEASDGRTGSVAIESAYPHRLLSWSWSRGAELLDSAQLTGSQRMKYWELHGEGQESLRKQLGL